MSDLMYSSLLALFGRVSLIEESRMLEVPVSEQLLHPRQVGVVLVDVADEHVRGVTHSFVTHDTKPSGRPLVVVGLRCRR